MNKTPSPGVSREARISDEGLQRLEQHLKNGPSMNPMILKKWIERYGDSARQLIRQYEQYSPDMD